MAKLPMVPRVVLALKALSGLSTSSLVRVPLVFSAALVSVSSAVLEPVIIAASLVPCIVTVSTRLVPSAVATVIESV
ncbi:hypothetical protein D3C72_1625710 [compost metagenome]